MEPYIILAFISFVITIVVKELLPLLLIAFLKPKKADLITRFKKENPFVNAFKELLQWIIVNYGKQ